MSGGGTTLPAVTPLLPGLLATVACTPGAVDSAAPHPWGEPTVPDGGPVTASGQALAFAGGGGGIPGAEVWVVEQPDRRTATDEDGHWTLADLPRGEWTTFELSHPDYVAIRTGTFLPGHDQDGGEALEQVTFQVPDFATFDLMAAGAGIYADGDLCQVATTVTRRGHSLYSEAGTHGEPGATAALSPETDWEAGPIYFNLVAYNLIYPDPELSETTDDGGVLWANVPLGDYLLEGAKDGAVIRPSRIACAAGVLVNASPPWGLQVLEGGLGPEDD